MHFNTFAILSLVTSVSAKLTSLSPAGKKLLANARKLEGNEEFDFSWVTDYSIKFQGCHHVAQWNEEANGEEDVRVMTKRLVRFRLCPSDSCSDSSASGCSGGYGDYIVDLNTFAEPYLESKKEDEEQACENLRENCDCDEADDQDACEYDCYVAADMTYCMDEGQDFAGFLECAQFGEYNDVPYYMGPYCAMQGGAVFLGLFTDETCTTFADDNGGISTFNLINNANGGEYSSMPFTSESMIGYECMSCAEADANYEGNYNGDANDADNVREVCEEVYNAAGKCESKLSVGYKNEAACQFIEGVKIIRKDGVIETSSSSKASTTATVFIVLFAIAFALLGGYVYYLKTKLDKAKINLSSE